MYPPEKLLVEKDMGNGTCEHTDLVVLYNQIAQWSKIPTGPNQWCGANAVTGLDTVLHVCCVLILAGCQDYAPTFFGISVKTMLERSFEWLKAFGSNGQHDLRLMCYTNQRLTVSSDNVMSLMAYVYLHNHQRHFPAGKLEFFDDDRRLLNGRAIAVKIATHLASKGIVNQMLLPHPEALHLVALRAQTIGNYWLDSMFHPTGKPDDVDGLGWLRTVDPDDVELPAANQRSVLLLPLVPRVSMSFKGVIQAEKCSCTALEVDKRLIATEVQKKCQDCRCATSGLKCSPLCKCKAHCSNCDTVTAAIPIAGQPGPARGSRKRSRKQT